MFKVESQQDGLVGDKSRGGPSGRFVMGEGQLYA